MQVTIDFNVSLQALVPLQYYYCLFLVGFIITHVQCQYFIDVCSCSGPTPTRCLRRIHTLRYSKVTCDALHMSVRGCLEMLNKSMARMQRNFRLRYNSHNKFQRFMQCIQTLRHVVQYRMDQHHTVVFLQAYLYIFIFAITPTREHNRNHSTEFRLIST